MKLILSVLVLTFSTVQIGTAQSKLIDQLQKLDVRTAFMVQSQAIDDYPIWSPNGDVLAVNIMGTWWGLEIDRVVLTPATWHQKTIAMWGGGPEAIKLTKAQVEIYKAASAPPARRIETKTGRVVALEPKGLGTEFSVTTKGSKDIWWTSELSSCFSLVSAPNPPLVAFLCPANGLFIANI